MISGAQPVIYWHTSAVLSALFRDAHSEDAFARARGGGVHLLSSLGWAETEAVVAQVERERAMSPVLVQAAREALDNGPWRLIHVSPDRSQMRELARRWPLRGADLWHLSLAKLLAAELPELRLLSYDARLNVSALGEGLA